MRQSLVMGNWKMNGSRAESLALAQSIVAGLESGDQGVAVCVPFVYLSDVRSVIESTPLALGAQNVADQEKGAYTGEVSAAMLKDCGCTYALVGHSERRSYYGDSDQSVAARFCQAQKQGIIPVLCVGETLEEREQDKTFAVIDKQLDAVIDMAGIDALANSVIAYEPVWAIGTGKTASDDQAQEVHKYIRQRIAEKSQEIADKIQILYGGSVKPDNAKALFAMPDIDGGLIGGASLDADSFLSIYRSI
ncbi:triose-phosphate isomerase [Methylomarinum sp. Ch1-1]|uniref:Triosephosphate isomerase n=1 Tax=Methylomarinum roseum TaxID=3067653 RepID=A0AAU7NTW8_9GAMM|nr:triose-phosphate isomerase [Methylomarinum sp. Ch1-1]MDP4519904.1 triose-phosphate isomerase [Methylomarinum sp. Ch1-1]